MLWWEKEWYLRLVFEDVGNRSYLVEVKGKYYSQNRRWLRTTAKELEPLETSTLTELTEPTEALSAEPLQS